MFKVMKKIFGGGQRPEPVRRPRRESPAGEDRESHGPWVGVDLDGTLAIWDNQSSLRRIGKPVPGMLEFVKRMLKTGIQVKIFTARAGDPRQVAMIKKWLVANGLPVLDVTNVKDYNMQTLYDDRCVQVERNTGRIISEI